MLQLYRMAGISKQAHYKRVKQQRKEAEITHQVLSSASKIKRHKRMGCRKVYAELKLEGIGRDKTEAILFSIGFRVMRKRNYYCTTYAGKKWYPK